jgi:hypothetical protein
VIRPSVHPFGTRREAVTTVQLVEGQRTECVAANAAALDCRALLKWEAVLKLSVEKKEQPAALVDQRPDITADSVVLWRPPDRTAVTKLARRSLALEPPLHRPPDPQPLPHCFS